MAKAKVYRNEPMIVSIKVNTDKVCIADPCYILNNDGENCVYDQLVCKKNWNNCLLGNSKLGGIFGLVKGTLYGDGCYSGDKHNNVTSAYGVDSGTLAMVDYHHCDENNYAFDEATVIDLGEYTEHELTMVHKDGSIAFYVDGKNVETIYTGDKKVKLPKKLGNVKL